MTIPTQTVQPGDLIRAELFNGVIHALAELDARLVALETSSPPTPDTGQVQILGISPLVTRIGDLMTVTGRNFELSLGAAVVTLDSLIVPNFQSPDSSDTKLVFVVPQVSNVPEVGKQVTLRVANFATHDERTVTILPRQSIFQGTIDLDYAGASPSPLAAGQPAFVQFTATSTGSPAVTLTLSASTSTGWTGIDILDALSPPHVLPSRQITVPALGQTAFFVRVPIPSGTASGTNFSLSVEGVGQGVATARMKQLTVGQAPPTEDPDIKRLDERGIDNGRISGSTIFVPATQTAELTVNVQFGATGDYDITFAFEPSTTGWSVLSDIGTPSPTHPSYTIQASDMHDGIADRTFLVDLTAPTSTSDQPQLHITAQHRGATLKKERTYQLSVGS